MQPLSLAITNLEDLSSLATCVADLSDDIDIILLQGDLGTGKSAFARCFLTHLDASLIEIPSPTFTLVQTYSTPTKEVWHFDLYRLTNQEEVYEIGIEEAFVSGVSLIEWPERFYYQSLRDYLHIRLDFAPSSVLTGQRSATLYGAGKWAERLPIIEKKYRLAPTQ